MKLPEKCFFSRKKRFSGRNLFKLAGFTVNCRKRPDIADKSIFLPGKAFSWRKKRFSAGNSV
jgi:hypothetical protein